MAISRATLPTTLVIFGVTGDLAARKIIPALWRLHRRGALPKLWRCIGVSRRDWTDEKLRDYLTGLLSGKKGVEQFVDHFVYQQADFNRLTDYRRLAQRLGLFDDGWRVCASKLFYLAVPPELYEPLLRRLYRSGLTAPCGPNEGWTRVIIEKPFGRDERTARRLERLLSELFHEEQIYRIDHYLGKELLQNILTFRFANRLWQGSWNARSISNISIKVWESDPVEPGRADSYDPVGALRDVGQNHLLQMLALLTMDDPGSLAADPVRERRAELLSLLSPARLERSWRAQYSGYRRLPGVAKNSRTETFFHVETAIDHPNWRGVPITLESGKGLPNSVKEAVVTFRQPRSCYCPSGERVNRVSSVLFKLEPEEGITISFWAKRPGVTAETELKQFSWRVKDEAADYGEPYERLLLDCFMNNQSLFVSTDEIRAAWRFIDPVRREWARHPSTLIKYKKGTEPVGPERAVVDCPSVEPSIGFIGLGKMGFAMAEQLLDEDWSVVAFDQATEQLDDYRSRGMIAVNQLKDLPAYLKGRPRVIWLMLPAGRVIDQTIFGTTGLVTGLRRGDIIIDGGNSHWKDSQRRAAKLKRRGLHFVDVGVSGGPAGARWGSVLLIGGEKAVVERLTDLWRALANDGRSYAHVGPSGAGHYAKMIHNGVEYGMMQSIAEGAALWEKADYRYPLTNLLELYNQGSVIESKLVGYLAEGLRRTGGRLDEVAGQVAQTGEGVWMVKEAERVGLGAPAVKAAVLFRRRSQKKPSLTGQLLSLTRGMFGGHDWRKKS